MSPRKPWWLLNNEQAQGNRQKTSAAKRPVPPGGVAVWHPGPRPPVYTLPTPWPPYVPSAAKTSKPARGTLKRAATPKRKAAKRRTQPTRKKPLKSRSIPIRHELILDILLPAYPNKDLRELSTSTVLVPKVAEGWDEACRARDRFGHVKVGEPDYPTPSPDTIDRVKKLYDSRRRHRR